MRGRPQTFRHAVTIQRPAREVYAFWRDLTNLPLFMRHLERVEPLDERRSRWTARSPAGLVRWETEIVDDEPGRSITWRTLPGAPVRHKGKVWFVEAPGGRGTEVHVIATYLVPGGAFGAAVAKLTGEEPSQQAREDLRHLKQVLECGEVVASDISPAARSELQQAITRFVHRRLATGGGA